MPRFSKWGTVRFFDADKGYGFIIPERGGPDVMFHSTVCHFLRTVDPYPEDEVSYEAARQPDGRWKATAVALERQVGSKPPKFLLNRVRVE